VIGELIKLAGLAFVILAIAWFVRRLGLGVTHSRINNAAHAIALAEEAECGFAGITAAVDTAGYGALVTNASGAVMLIRAHGVRFAARRIGPGWHARLDRRMLTLSAIETSFGTVTLDFGDATAEVAARLRGVLKND
jgi:hypothetical protein